VYKIKTTHRFDKEVKLCKKRGYDISKLEEVVCILEEFGKLPSKYKPHKLSGKYKDCWECHIQPDWLLIWLQDDEELVLILTNTGTHSDLF